MKRERNRKMKRSGTTGTRKSSRPTLPKTDVLKIDQDCCIDTRLEKEYLRNIIANCKKKRRKVLWIKQSVTPHGRHYEIRIHPPIEPHAANNLQLLCGDDAKRYAFNRARIKSGLVGWNKLWWYPRSALRTVYLRNWYQ
jgi:hypothetical protein